MKISLIIFCYNFFIGINYHGLCFALDKNESQNQITSHLYNSYKSKTLIPIDLDIALDVWNPKNIIYHCLSKNINDKLINLSALCSIEILRYINGISAGFNWALRMNDASGRYTSGFFSGNKYWIGAFDQCRQMQNEFIINDTIYNKSDEIMKVDYLLPFAVAVSSVNLKIQLYISDQVNHTQIITLGLCLPASCRPIDITKLLEFYISNNSKDSDNYERHNKKITVNYVRNLSDGYLLWKDTTFHIILGFTAFILLFVILGTCYDIILRYKYLDKLNDKSRNNNATSFVVNEKIAQNCMNPIKNNKISIIYQLMAMKEHNRSLDAYNGEKVPKPMSEALLSFSLLLNLSKLTTFDVGQDTLAPIHGLRFISMLWIILVHTCLLTNEISDSYLFRSNAESSFFYQTISNGSYAVDTFFFISGCLVAFLYFQTMSKRKLNEKSITKGFKGKLFQYFGMMTYRYLRLTPPYLLVIGITQMSMKWHHDHSMIELTTLDYMTCEKYWWRNALYINTYFDMDERCMVWSWYLANDTQFFTFGILILIIGGSFFAIGASIGVFILFVSWITTVIITLQIKHTPSIEDPFANYESLYDKPWSRIGPYLIGMATGWYLHHIDCKLKISKAILMTGWCLSIATLMSIVYGIYGKTFSPIASALYTALSHSGWAMSIAWILVTCVTNNAGFITKILSWKYLYPLSRLTYCAYLIHPVLTRTIILRGESMLHLSQLLIAMLFLGITITSYVLSLFLSLLYEAPMVSLLRIVHPLRQWKNRNSNDFINKNVNEHEI